LTVAFEWDEAKSRRNAVERGLPFELAMALFSGPILEREDTRFDYGERRIVALGAVEGRCFVAVYTPRGAPDRPVRRIISFRKATREESHVYRQAYPERP
jgi:uncharacterized DUF497 family protein